MLKIQEAGKPSTAIWLVNASTIVGSNRNCDLVLTSGRVADQHIELTRNGDDVYLQDCSRGKSIFVNDLPVGEYGPLKHGDSIRLADVDLEILEPREMHSEEELLLAQQTGQPIPTLTDVNLRKDHWHITATESWLKGQSFDIRGTMVLGRGSTCDITIPGTHLSRQHAQLIADGDHLTVRDLDSSNGTYVNGERISEAHLHAGDKIRFDVLTFVVQAPKRLSESDKTVIRQNAKSHPEEERKSTNGDTKQWITRPTSVGNRIEELPRRSRADNFVFYSLITTLLASVVLYAVINFF